MYTIVGGGFGLYGYLPALIEYFQESVVLPQRYQSLLQARPELATYSENVIWAPDRESAFALASGLVVATPPEAQPAIVQDALRFPQIETFFLEKPVAVSPPLSATLMQALRQSGRRFRIGYTFLHTAWSALVDPAVTSATASGAVIKVTWKFMAHHIANGLDNWKRSHARGGGVIRFYGIHVLALLAAHGYRAVRSSTLSGDTQDQSDRWQAIFDGPGLPACSVDVDMRSHEPCFLVEIQEGRGEPNVRIVALANPFASSEPSASVALDPRVAVLRRLLATIQDSDEETYRVYEATNGLWNAVEAASSFHCRPPSRGQALSTKADIKGR